MQPNRAQIEALIRSLAAAEELPADVLIRQCETESAFNPEAENPKTKAFGLFQFMPATAADEKINPKRWHENVFGGVRYLGKMNRMFGSLDKALAAYNWGPGNLKKCIAAYGDGWRAQIPAETKGYLKKILRDG